MDAYQASKESGRLYFYTYDLLLMFNIISVFSSERVSLMFKMIINQV